MFSRTRMPSAATALLGLAALFCHACVRRGSGVALRLDQHRKHCGLRSGPAAVRKGGRGGIRRPHRSGAEAARRLRQAGRAVHHGREGRHRDGGERAGLPSRPLPAILGDGAALHVRELDRRHLGDDVSSTRKACSTRTTPRSRCSASTCCRPIRSSRPARRSSR